MQTASSAAVTVTSACQHASNAKGHVNYVFARRRGSCPHAAPAPARDGATRRRVEMTRAPPRASAPTRAPRAVRSAPPALLRAILVLALVFPRKSVFKGFFSVRPKKKHFWKKNMATLPQTAPSRVPAAACGGSRAGKCSGSLDAAEGLPRGASPWTGAMHRAAKPAGMMLDDQLAGDHAFDPQGSSLEFTEKGSILWKGFKIGDKGVMAAPDGAPPSSGVLALPPLPCRPPPALLTCLRTSGQASRRRTSTSRRRLAGARAARSSGRWYRRRPSPPGSRAKSQSRLAAQRTSRARQTAWLQQQPAASRRCLQEHMLHQMTDSGSVLTHARAPSCTPTRVWPVPSPCAGNAHGARLKLKEATVRRAPATAPQTAGADALTAEKARHAVQYCARTNGRAHTHARAHAHAHTHTPPARSGNIVPLYSTDV